MIPTQRVPGIPASSNRRFTILCIDDDPAIAKIYQKRLQTSVVRVLIASNASEGYNAALESNSDLILLDHHLPDEDGFHLLGRLRSHPHTTDTPVLILTGSDTPTLRRQTFLLGVSGLLAKPINFGELMGHVSKFVPGNSASCITSR